jgi:hypothetical protein
MTFGIILSGSLTTKLGYYMPGYKTGERKERRGRERDRRKGGENS